MARIGRRKPIWNFAPFRVIALGRKVDAEWSDFIVVVVIVISIVIIIIAITNFGLEPDVQKKLSPSTSSFLC